MGEKCIFCGGDCGRVCRGIGFKSSGGDRPKAVKPSVGPAGGVMLERQPAHQKPSIEGGARKSGARASGVTREKSESDARTVSPSMEAKRGRPRIGEKREKPWEALGLSERTYYRRKAEEGSKSK